MQLLGLALIGVFITGRNSAGERIPKGRAVLRPGEWRLKSLNPSVGPSAEQEMRRPI